MRIVKRTVKKQFNEGYRAGLKYGMRILESTLNPKSSFISEVSNALMDKGMIESAITNVDESKLDRAYLEILLHKNDDLTWSMDKVRLTSKDTATDFCQSQGGRFFQPNGGKSPYGVQCPKNEFEKGNGIKLPKRLNLYVPLSDTLVNNKLLVPLGPISDLLNRSFNSKY